MELQVLPVPKYSVAENALARSIRDGRDYREVKSLLARTLRSSRSPQASLRAQALLGEIIAYEVRLDTETVYGLGSFDRPVAPGFGGPRRRWSDLTA